MSPSSGPADARQQDQVPSPMQGPEAGRSPYPGQQTRNLLPVGHSHLVSIPAPLQGSPCIFCEINLFTVLLLCSIIILCCGLCCVFIVFRRADFTSHNLQGTSFMAQKGKKTFFMKIVLILYYLEYQQDQLSPEFFVIEV